jgi:tetratricopeptide (TPR) repeat protein
MLQKLQLANQLIKKNKYEESETLLLTLLDCTEIKHEVFSALSSLCVKTGRLDDAITYQKELCVIFPKNKIYQNTLANLYFNLAYKLKSHGDFQEATEHYSFAIDNNITQPEEAYLNMAVIFSDCLRKEEKAISCLKKALALNPTYTPALYNLANIHEEIGNKSDAKQYFYTILDIEPSNYQVIVRLAEIKKFTDKSDDLIAKMQAGLCDTAVDRTTEINLNYALGKAFNELEQFEEAFIYFDNANKLELASGIKYNKKKHEETINNLISFFNKSWFNKLKKVSDESPIFICGMFRSGSTLLEQILAAHPDVGAGGELNYFPSLIKKNISPFPEQLLNISADTLNTIANNYILDIKKKFPNSTYVTDKRPDNFLYIGLIKSLFPKAKIIFTQRHPIDNCLSIYFCRLDKSERYAVNLSDIAHYYQEHEKLINHWKSIFPDDIFSLDYEKLIHDFNGEVKSLLNYLNLEWHDDCLEFYNVKNKVKTASIWQVREPLYTSSSGRRNNFVNQSAILRDYF